MEFEVSILFLFANKLLKLGLLLLIFFLQLPFVLQFKYIGYNIEIEGGLFNI